MGWPHLIMITVELVGLPSLDAGGTVICASEGLKLQQAAMLQWGSWMVHQVVLGGAGNTSMAADVQDALEGVLPGSTCHPHPVCRPLSRVTRSTQVATNLQDRFPQECFLC